MAENLEKFNPIHSMGKAALGDAFPLNGDDYLEMTRVVLSSIPVVGEIVNCVFGIIWGKVFPVEDPYLRKDDFEKRMKKMYEDMEKMMDKKIDDEIVKFCSSKFESMCSQGFNFAENEKIYQSQKNGGKPISEAVKRYMAANHAVYRHLLEECLIFFSRDDKIDLLGTLYLQTAILYLAFLRDTYFFGIEWGLPEELINGLEEEKIKPMKQKIHECIQKTYQHYSKYFNSVNRANIEEVKNPYRQKGNILDHNGMMYMGYLPIKWKVNFNTLTSELLFADLTLYPFRQIWLQQTDSEGNLYSQSKFILCSYGTYFFRIPSNISNRIYTIDCHEMTPMRGGFSHFEYEGLVNSVTGARGLSGSKSDSLYFKTFILSNTKKLSFRTYAIIPKGTKVEWIIRQLPKEKAEYSDPDSTGGGATKNYSEQCEYNHVFDSTYGSVGIYTTKEYTFEEGGVYVELKGLNGKGGDFKFSTLEIIDRE